MSVKNKRKPEKNISAVFLKGLAAGLFAAISIVFLVSFLIERFELDTNRITAVMIFIYIIAAFTSGIVISIRQHKGSLFHSISAAMILVILHLIYSLIAGKGKLNSYTLLIAICAAAFGSFIGNKTALLIKKQRRHY